ncbi:hypothetical protein PIB30_075263 [Stylosanthes scabra]|nr:hypothetical protein [Stylosanthes scabra]
MGRGRGRGKTLSITNHEDFASGGGKEVVVHKRRGRPQKLPKDDFVEEIDKIEVDESGMVNNGVSNKEVKIPNTLKRTRFDQLKEKLESELENGIVNRMSFDDLSKSNGFRRSESKRKSKPCRAAEVGLQCK